MRNCLLTLFVLFSIDLFGQGFTPIVTQFTKKDYNAANQNWSVGQGKDGIMYFGNNQGLLQFDGSRWELCHMPENKIVRSLLVAGKRLIFVGSFEEFGYFSKDGNGRLTYTSLSSKLKGYQMQNDEIWNILNINGTIVFQSFTSYFTYRNGRVSGYRCPYTFLFFSNWHNTIYTHTDQKGFCYLDARSHTFLPVKNCPLTSPVIAVLPVDPGKSLLVTKTDGLYLYDDFHFTRFQTEADAELQTTGVNRAVIAPNGLIIIGTILNGVTAINKRGQKVWTLNTANVLPNNTVLGMYCDRDNNLWLALDKGIAMIQLNSSISYI
ncbi:MAG: two-component regulator propeller domain-containing protein, partial [Bacteroidota bacterium]|nr:two-component regulator propeller domain-containing protein [Bacteroidota bacterium]